MNDCLVAGSTYRFQNAITKNGELWDLTGAAVTLYLRQPDGAVLEKVATVYDPAGGLVRYDSLPADLPAAQAGDWARTWRVVQGAVVVESLPIPFLLVAPRA
jgi:BppU N-terminal domain